MLTSNPNGVDGVAWTIGNDDDLRGHKGRTISTIAVLICRIYRQYALWLAIP